jgi:TolB-like protein
MRWWIVPAILSLSSAAQARDIWPYRSAVIVPAPVYSDPTSEPIHTARLSYPALTREINRMLQSDVRFGTIGSDQYRSATLAGGDDLGLRLADSIREDGIEQFEHYEIASAISSLRDAVRLYRDASAARIDPRGLSEAYQYLGRAYLERSRTEPSLEVESLSLARRAFKEMIRLHPSANLEEGLYPPVVVEIFQQAYLELLADDGEALELSEEDAQELARELNLDYLIYPYVLRDRESVRLVIQVVTAEGWRTVFRQVVPLTEETETSVERVSRAVSLFVACAPLRYEEELEPDGIDAGRYFLQIGWGLTFYGDKPTEQQFLNQGLGITLDYHFTEHLGVFGRTSVIFGDRDPDGNLLNGFTSFRSAVGIEFSVRVWDTLRLFLGLGLEVNRVGGFTETDEFWCKVTGGTRFSFGPGRQCLSSDVTLQQPAVLVGPYLMPGATLELFEDFAGYFQGGFAFYLSDFSNVDFPLGGEVGIEYRF